MMQTRPILETVPRAKGSIIVAESWAGREANSRTLQEAALATAAQRLTSQQYLTSFWCDGSTKNTRAAARTWRCSVKNSTKCRATPTEDTYVYGRRHDLDRVALSRRDHRHLRVA